MVTDIIVVKRTSDEMKPLYDVLDDVFDDELVEQLDDVKVIEFGSSSGDGAVSAMTSPNVSIGRKQWPKLATDFVRRRKACAHIVVFSNLSFRIDTRCALNKNLFYFQKVCFKTIDGNNFFYRNRTLKYK